MHRKKLRLLFFVTVVLFCFAGKSAFAFLLSKEKNILLVVPARPRMVELAFDINRLYPVEILSSCQNPDFDKPVLYIWKEGMWSYVSLDAFCSKQFTRDTIDKVIFMGRRDSIPSILPNCMQWALEIEHIETFNISEILNSLDNTMNFNESQWRWLAKRYGLNLMDLNAGKRTSNPYDIKRSELPVDPAEFMAEKQQIPPAVMLEEDEVEELEIVVEEHPKKESVSVEEKAVKIEVPLKDEAEEVGEEMEYFPLADPEPEK